ARGVVSLELNSADKERLAFLDVHVQGEQLLLIVNLGVRDGGKVDVANLAIGLAQVIQPLLDEMRVKDITVFDRKKLAQQRSILNGQVVGKVDGLEPVLVTFLDRYGDVHGLALAFLDEGNMENAVLISELRGRIFYQGLEITVMPQSIADTLRIFFQLGGVKCPGEQVFQ